MESKELRKSKELRTNASQVTGMYLSHNSHVSYKRQDICL